MVWRCTQPRHYWSGTMMPLFIVPHFSPSLPPLCFASSVPLSHQGREALASSYAPYRLYNIGNNEPMQLMQYIRAIESALGMQAKMNMLPMQAGMCVPRRRMFLG